MGGRGDANGEAGSDLDVRSIRRAVQAMPQYQCVASVSLVLVPSFCRLSESFKPTWTYALHLLRRAGQALVPVRICSPCFEVVVICMDIF